LVAVADLFQVGVGCEVMIGRRFAEQLAKNARVGHPERFVDELRRDDQPRALAHLDPGFLVKHQRIDQDAIVIEDRHNRQHCAQSSLPTGAHWMPAAGLAEVRTRLTRIQPEGSSDDTSRIAKPRSWRLLSGMSMFCCWTRLLISPSAIRLVKTVST